MSETEHIVVERVERDRILELRRRVLNPSGRGTAAFPGDSAPTTRHWAALVDGQVVGCVTVMQLRGQALRGMAVAPELRRQGIGRKLMDAVDAEVNEDMWCNARSGALHFYEAMGWRAVGPVFELGENGPHQRMVWTVERFFRSITVGDDSMVRAMRRPSDGARLRVGCAVDA